MARIGMFLSLGSPEVAEILAPDIELLVIDAEHGRTGDHDTTEIMRSISYVPHRWVRVSRYDACGKVFDAGASGVLVPQIRTVEDVKQAVRWSHYPPRGNRGLGPGRIALYGKSMNRALESDISNEVWIQIETLESLVNLEQILQVDGVDGYFIGPGDLSSCLGYPGQMGHPDVENMILQIISQCKSYHRRWGIFSATREIAERWLELGADLVLVGSDASLLIESSQKFLDWKGKMS